MPTFSYDDLAKKLDSSNSIFTSHFLKNVGFSLNLKFNNLLDFHEYANDNFDLHKNLMFDSLGAAELIYKNDINKEDILNRRNFSPYITLITEMHKPNSFSNAMLISVYKRTELNKSILNHTYSEQLSQVKNLVNEKYSKHYRWHNFKDTMGDIIEIRYYFCYDYYTQIYFDDFEPQYFSKELVCNLNRRIDL